MIKKKPAVFLLTSFLVLGLFVEENIFAVITIAINNTSKNKTKPNNIFFIIV